MHMARLPPSRLPTAPVFQTVTQHHAVCRVVGEVSSLRLHPAADRGPGQRSRTQTAFRLSEEGLGARLVEG